MSAAVRIAAAAERDLQRAIEYIETVLKNPQATDDLLDDLNEQLRLLADFPEKHPLAGDRVLAAWGVRYMPVKNYLAFYTFDADKATIFILRFLYAKSNWHAILKDIPTIH